MDGKPPGLDFALIGHIESWQKASDFLHAIRSPGLERLSLEKIKDIFCWIPPRKVFGASARSTCTGREVKGAYIETFISPEQLEVRHFGNLLQKVKDAAECAARLGAKVATLGGFTSIVLEGNTNLLHGNGFTAFTTGNALTAAFIAKGMEKACAFHGIDLSECSLLLIGSTGDIGSACAAWFAPKVKTLLLHARKAKPLEQQCLAFQNQGYDCRFSGNLAELLPQSDLVISVASTAAPVFSLEDCPLHVLVCDAGYPKNIAVSPAQANRVWHGGMGQVTGGYVFEPDYSQSFYDYPGPSIGHGCMLESVVLAMEGRFESFSTGRGCITPARMEEIWQMAIRHGVRLAPFFNSGGLWQGTEIN